jgi:hypothetical protein
MRKLGKEARKHSVCELVCGKRHQALICSVNTRHARRPCRPVYDQTGVLEHPQVLRYGRPAESRGLGSSRAKLVNDWLIWQEPRSTLWRR